MRRGSTLFDELAKTGELLGGETDLARADAATKRSGVQKAKHILEKAGCEHSEAVIKSALEILDSGLRGIPVRVDDLMRVRKCARTGCRVRAELSRSTATRRSVPDCQRSTAPKR